MKVTVQYYDGPPLNSHRTAAETKAKADKAIKLAEANHDNPVAQDHAAKAKALADKADADTKLEPDKELRKAVKDIAAKHGAPLTVVDGQNHHLEASNPGHAAQVMEELMLLPNIQVQTAA